MASLINQQITLDLIPGPVVKTVSVSQYDTGTRTLQFKIQNDGVDFTIPSGITASIEATKKDLTGFSYPCTISGNVVSVVVQPQMTVFPGKTMCEVVFKQGNDRIGTANFWLKVEDAALNDSTIISETDIPGIANLSEAVRTAVESAESAEQDALDAEAWAVGTRGGEAVPSTDPTYHNNSKYYSETFEGDVDRIEALVQQAEALAESIYSIGIVEEASGDPASFADGASGVPMKSVSVDIDPVQDLHGYEYPWVGGANKNLLDTKTVTKNGVTFTADPDGYVTASPSNSDTRGFTFAYSQWTVQLKAGTYNIDWEIKTVPTISGRAIAVVSSSGTLLSYTPNYTASGTSQFTISEDTEVGVVAKIFDGAIRFQIRKSTDAQAWSPYSNVCPISGWDEVKVTRTGKNLFDPSKATDGKYINSNGEEGTSATFACSDYIPVHGIRMVYFSGFNGGWGNAPCYALYDKDKRKIRATHPNTNITSLPVTIEGAYYLRTSMAKSDKGTVMIEVGDTATSYEAYNGQTYPISLTSAGTVYGGTLDVDTGELVVDRKMVDVGSIEWSVSGSGDSLFYYKSFADAKPTAIESTAPEKMTCENYRTVSRSDLLSTDASCTVNPRRIIGIKDSRYTTVASFREGTNGVKLVYEIESPLTYTLTPTQITSLLGVNHIWADCGEVAVEYVADTKIYIQSLLASQG